jgi:hypothetical protein
MVAVTNKGVSRCSYKYTRDDQRKVWSGGHLIGYRQERHHKFVTDEKRQAVINLPQINE